MTHGQNSLGIGLQLRDCLGVATGLSRHWIGIDILFGGPYRPARALRDFGTPTSSGTVLVVRPVIGIEDRDPIVTSDVALGEELIDLWLAPGRG